MKHRWFVKHQKANENRPKHAAPSASNAPKACDNGTMYKKMRPSRARLLERGHAILAQKKQVLIWASLAFLIWALLNRSMLFRALCRAITLYFQSSSQFTTIEHSLWRGSLPDTMILVPREASATLNLDLVISHCNLPLNWIFEWASPLAFSNITIISKCNEKVIGAPESANIVRLTNVGRCDHSYAHHIYRNYNTYSRQMSSNHDMEDNRSFVIFLKDSDNSNRNHYSRHRSLKEMIQISSEFGFACHEEPGWVWSQQSMLQSFHPVCQISAYHNWTLLEDYTRIEYSRLRRDNNSEFASKIGATLGEYALTLGIPRPPVDIVPVCYGGNFMVQRRQLNNKPRELWGRIEQSLSRANNIAEGHFVERLWATLLVKPLDQALVDQLLHQQRSVCRADANYAGALTK